MYSFATVFTVVLTYLGIQGDTKHTLTDVSQDGFSLTNIAHADFPHGGGVTGEGDADSGGNGEGGPDSGGAPY